MFRRYLAILTILGFSISILAQNQNPDGKLIFILMDGCKKISFIENEIDSVYFDSDKKFKLEIKLCVSNKCESIPEDKISYNFLSNPGSYSHLKDSTVLKIAYGYTQNLKIIITKEGIDKEKMILDYKNVYQIKFSSKIKFKPVMYKIDLKKTFQEKKIKRKGGYYPFIEQRFFKKIKTNDG